MAKQEVKQVRTIKSREELIEDIINAGNTKEIKLRTELAKNAHPKLDTTLYRVQISDRA